MSDGLNRHMRRLAGLVIEHTAGGTVLDGGCGDGRCARYLAALGCRVLAVDLKRPSPDAFEDLPDGSSGELSFQQADLFQLSPQRTFDAVALFGVLHYAGSRDRVRDLLTRAASWLTPRGMLAASWITPDIPLTHAQAYLPPKTSVRGLLNELRFQQVAWWEAEVRHAHDGLLCHSHHIVYSAWQRIVEDSRLKKDRVPLGRGVKDGAIDGC